MSLHQCSYCEKSFFSLEERLSHEDICAKNNKSDKQRFETRTKK